MCNNVSGKVLRGMKHRQNDSRDREQAVNMFSRISAAMKAKMNQILDDAEDPCETVRLRL